jgi:hypothetical protein
MPRRFKSSGCIGKNNVGELEVIRNLESVVINLRHTSLFILRIDLSIKGRVHPVTVITVLSVPRGGKLMKVASSSMISLNFSSFSVIIQSILLPWSTTSLDRVIKVAF